ncbi:uncharacterized protein BO96DRAFT_491635 [Aspergillus niger CBS 101883]|uniref:uncharacterized protein n=1 Tax=Aspergillus lacticoffeatus (strain CBS 101883) TaxID=1450533 RepID=UPI000D7FA8BC|nr:uncharacterized protein BO96DRAFT_491635 [Aspergillus niger CBS 101883]PYH50341.1 hypothetical protein BO96DRAFT_491635 [Aspergillus niger CBS 101883]
MPLLILHAKVNHVDVLTGRLAAVELKEEEEARNPRYFNPFTPYLKQGLPRFMEHLAREISPESLSSLRQTRQLLKELLYKWLDFPVILLLNPSPFDVLGYEQMVQQSPTLGWLEKNLEVLKLKLHDVIVMDTFPMVTDKLLESKRFAENLSELVTDSFELTWTCLQYIQPQIVISCQGSSKARNKKWGSSGGLRTEEMSSSEASTQQELVKIMDVDGHQMFVVQGVHPQYVMQHNQLMEEMLKKLFTKVLGPFGRWKERRLAERRETARAEVILVKESVRDGMKSLIKQIQLFNQICKQEGRNGAELSETVKRVEEWQKQIKS